MDDAPAACLSRARRSLEGLSVGDAFGETFVGRYSRIERRAIVDDIAWRWTDDTAMALSLVEELALRADVDEDALAARFARRYQEEPWRGYGGTAHGILTAIADGVPWQTAAKTPFGGQGSKGNGSAMRVAPVGAYFAHDLERAIDVARKSARPTHLHRDGEAGAIAVAVAAVLAARVAAGEQPRDPAAFLATIYEHTPTSLTRDGIDLAMRLAPDTSIAGASSRLGNGSRVVCDDTVPLCVWIAAHHLGDYEDALWSTVAALGDMDTTCATVGGILAAGGAVIPAEWLARREPLPSV
ncbi:MAG: ADP-ribosylglycohydrolase family protein [Deltaproteobacteria bacterium]|nr:ADP-ribosylglycohydrolase family protein [Kofleriaceae bacterium]